MATYKIVNGKKILLTSSEESALLADRATEKTKTDELNRLRDLSYEAGARIKKLVPTSITSDSKEKLLERQVNLMMLNAELDLIVINGGTLTTSQQSQKNTFIALKDSIKAIRLMYKSAKANGDTLLKFDSDLRAAGY